MQPPPRALNAPLEEGGARRSWGQCGRTQDVAAPWAARLAAFGVWAPDWAWAFAVLVFCLGVKYEWAFAYVLLECAFLIAHFGVFSHIVQQNMYIPKLMENVSFGIYICFILFKC